MAWAGQMMLSIQGRSGGSVFLNLVVRGFFTNSIFLLGGWRLKMSGCRDGELFETFRYKSWSLQEWKSYPTHCPLSISTYFLGLRNRKQGIKKKMNWGPSTWSELCFFVFSHHQHSCRWWLYFLCKFLFN